MDNTCNFPNTPDTSINSNIVPPTNGTLSRRRFMRFFTVGAAAVAVQGCGGGGGTIATANPPQTGPIAQQPTPVVTTPEVPASIPAAPIWLDIPAITFTQGVASSISVANYISVADAAAVTLTLNATPLPTGVTFNAAARSFDYDGIGAVSAADGYVLTATVG